MEERERSRRFSQERGEGLMEKRERTLELRIMEERERENRGEGSEYGTQ
jgi:hypothetical protein